MKHRFLFLAWSLIAFAATASAQNFRHLGVEFEACREVRLPADLNPEVAVTDFYHHGRINSDGTNIIVLNARDGKPVPTRVLQLGPGDFCRIAFQPVEKRDAYDVFYGGSAPQPDAIPKWTAKAGLLLETRAFRHCNLNRFESVKEAFEAARPIGAGYVDGVSHTCNPFASGKGAFFSRYSGTLHIDKGGETHFWTASQDASFLVIDGKLVVAAPGRHRPLRQAKPTASGKLNLTPGPHAFEYYHAAAGPEAMMVAAWHFGPLGKKPKPSAIESKRFRTETVVRVEAGPPTLVGRKPIPDFGFRVVGDCPLPDHAEPLVGVAFENRTPSNLTLKAKIRWDFGDGQSSEQIAPAHVYLKPGLYAVTLSVKRGQRTLEATNRIEIVRPEYLDRRQKDAKTKQHTIDDYLPVLDRYDPAMLPLPLLKRLVDAYLWKAETVVSPKENPKKDDQNEEEEANPEAALQRALAERRAAAVPFVRKAVHAGQAPFMSTNLKTTDDSRALRSLAIQVGTLARERLGDSKTAHEVLRRAAILLAKDRSAAADCAARAADIELNDLLSPQEAKSLLETADEMSGTGTNNSVTALVQRVRGDYFASQGKRDEARKAYSQAAESVKDTRQHSETTAWSGAYGRSTEQYLQTGQWDRAMSELQVWQNEFPLEKLDGYWHLKFIRYWMGRKMYAQAVAQTEQLLTLNPTSAYADRVLWLAAQSDYLRGKKDRAEATLHSLIEDYPGSPLLPEAKAAIEMLKQGEWEFSEGTK